MTVDFVSHSIVGGRPLCGAPDPGPMPLVAGPLRVIACPECSDFAGGMPEEVTMRAKLERTRGMLRAKLDGLTAGERAMFAESLASVTAAAGLDPDSRANEYSEAEVLAALYGVAALQGALWQGLRAGLIVMPPVLLEIIGNEISMVVVAIAEGLPTG